jgi:hypothetical protein
LRKPCSSDRGAKASADRSLRLLVANPGASIATGNARLAIGHGLDRNAEVRLYEILNRPKPATALREIVAKQEEATIVLADAAAPGGPTLEAWRGATSSFEAYLVDIGIDREPSICDHFRDAVALVPLGSERSTQTPLPIISVWNCARNTHLCYRDSATRPRRTFAVAGRPE